MSTRPISNSETIETELRRLRTELAEQQRNMRLLREIALVSRGGANLQDIFAVLYSRLAAVLQIDAFYVALCDRPDSLSYHFALFIDEGERIDPSDHKVGGLTGWILEIKESRLFHDLHAELQTDAPSPERFGNRERRSRSWLGVPLMIGRSSMGVISIQSYEVGAYRESDLHLVEALADLMTVAIENAVLYHTQDELSHSLATRVAARSEELAVLTAIASGLSRGQYDDARLTEALERILWMLNLHAGVIWLNDSPTKLRRAAVYAIAGSTVPEPILDEYGAVIPDPITADALSYNHPIMRSTTAPTPAYGLRQGSPAAYPEMTTDTSWSVFAMPLVAHGRTAGIVTLYAESGRELQSHEQSLLEAACQQMAIGVENARLYRDARTSTAIAERRADNLTLVHRISRLVSSSLDQAEIVEITAEQVVRLFGVDHCGILLFDEEGARGEVVAEYPALGAQGIRAIFVPGDYLEEVPGRGELGLITDIAHDPRARAVRDIALRMGIQISLLIPLISRGRSIGVITLNMLHHQHEFSDEERELGRTIAAQVAIALENARLYQMTRTRVEQEMEIARSIQANLFPRQLPAIPGASLAGRCLPALETGGDFYDVLPVDDDRFGFSIGDVSGKSLPAAMLMAVARSIVRSEAIDHATPERVVTETNRLVAQDVPPSTFVSLCYAVYEATTRRLILANAGHIVPLIRRGNGNMEWTTPPSNLPLGILEDTQYDAIAEQLYPGDSVLFMTDGLIEVFSPEGQMFGFDRLAELFGRCGALPAKEVVATLLDTICLWRGRPDRDDNMTAVVLQIT